MKSPRGRSISAMLLAVVLTASAAPALAGAGDPFYERSLMVAANARCGLFSPAIASALDASALQARGAALRAGVAETALKASKSRAEAKARGLACASPDLAQAATRVRTAFEGYAKIWKMNFPGAAASWAADRARPTDLAPAARWALSQTASGGMVLGVVLHRQGQALTAVIPGAADASSARLIMRDPVLAPAPYLDPKAPGLQGRTPPRSVTRAWLASERGPAPAGLAKAGGQAFRFPDTAIEALQALDPREAVVLELVYSSRTGEQTRQTLFEVGDFAAAQAFLDAR